MTLRDWSVLAFKLFSVWLVAWAIITLAGIPALWDPTLGAVRVFSLLSNLLPSLAALGAGFALWLAAEWLADRVSAGASASATGSLPLPPEAVLRLALCVFGVVLVVDAIPNIAIAVVLFRESRALMGPDQRQMDIWNAMSKANLAASVARLAIGLVFLAGPARMARLLSRVRKEMTGSLVDDEPPKPEGPAA